MITKRYDNLDAATGVFFNRQLEKVRAQTFDVKYPTLKIASGMIIPIISESGPGANTTVYVQYDQVGVAKLISNYATDLPRSDVKGTEYRHPIKSAGAAYGYNIQEIEAAKMAGLPLTARKAKAARRSIMQLIDLIGFSGDSAAGLVGLNGNPHMTEYDLPADGTGDVKDFSAKNADQIIRDLNGLANTPYIVTNEVEFADTLLMDQNIYSLIANLPRGNTDTSVLKWFMDNNPHIKNIAVLPRLSTAGAGSTSRIIAYRRDPEAIQYDVPVMYRELAPQEKGLEIEVPIHARIGSVIFPYPLAMAYADGA